jgi:hypothetical protein
MVSIEKNYGFLHLALFGAKQSHSHRIIAKQAQLVALCGKKA